MKNRIIFLALMLGSGAASAQVGIGTTTPNSTLDVRGSVSLRVRTVTADTQLDQNDHAIVFTGTTATTITLPDATTCSGRSYRIKNASTAGVTPSLTIATGNGENIDGVASIVLSQLKESALLFSDGTNWIVGSQSIPQTGGSTWNFDGNNISSTKLLGTISYQPLPFITNNIERMRIAEDGFIGLGNTSPKTEFHILSGTEGSGISTSYINGVTITGVGGYGFGGPGFYLENTDNPVAQKLFKINYTANGGSDAYVNYQAVSDDGSANVNANILSVMHSGRVGVGTATFNATHPEKFLVDAGNTSSKNVMGAKGSINDALIFQLQNTNGGLSATSTFSIAANNASGNTNFLKAGINSSTNNTSGIKGGANTAYLSASGTDFVIGNETNGRALVFFTDGSNTTNERARITSEGIVPGADNTYTLGKTGLRWTEVWSVNGTIQTSDIRFKKNINALTYGLKEVMLMRPVSYDWIEQPQQHKIGLIAQEVKKLVPEVVSGDDTKGQLGMNYAELVPVLINAIQELKAQVDELKKQLELKENKKGQQ